MSTFTNSATGRTSSSTDPAPKPGSGRPRGAARATDPPRPRPAGPDGVAWVCWLFVLNILFQRVSLPGISIPFTVPFTLAWLLLAWYRGVIVLERRRFVLWLVAAAAAAAVALPQTLLVDKHYISVNSWAFWMAMWLPVAFMMADRSGQTYLRALRALTTIGLWLSGLSVVFIASQVVIPYRDLVGQTLPKSMQVQDFAISYPFVYGSPWYKSNGWIMLEPSFMAFTLGVCLLAALVARARPWKAAWIFLGMVPTVAGSGFAVLGVGVIAMILLGQKDLIRPYVVPGVIAAAIAVPTALGEIFLTRLTEVSDSNSSAALRTIEPYVYLWPRWIDDPARVWFGAGAGSSRQAVEGSGQIGLIAPTVGKMFYEYGILAGSILLALMVAAFLRPHERALSIAMIAQFFILQPPSQPLIVPAFLAVTLWCPAPRDYVPAGRPGNPLEPEPSAETGGDRVRSGR